MRRSILWLSAAVTLAGAALPAKAQETAETRITVSESPVASARRFPTACTSYAACALRIEPSFRHGPRIVRGAEGVPAARLEIWRSSEVMQLFADNDSASSYGRRYKRAERVNRPLTYGGIILAAAGLSLQHRVNVLSLTGAGMLLVSAPYGAAAHRDLSRAVWWYNAGLAAAPGR